MKKKIMIICLVCSINSVFFAGCGKSSYSSQSDLQIENAEPDTVKEESGKSDAQKTEEAAYAKPDQKQVENAFHEIGESMRGYIGVILMTHWIDNDTVVEDSIDLQLSDAEKIRAAALACEADGLIDSYFTDDNDEVRMDETASSGPDGNGYHGWSVSNESVEKNCLDLFGTEAVWDAFQTKEQNTGFDAVKYTDSTGTHAILLSDEIEDETAQENHAYRVRMEDGKYFGEVDMYWGYWGYLQNDPELSNYTVTYELVPNENSKYGVAVSAVNIRKTEDNTDSAGEPAVSEDNYYGVFVAASKEIDDCTKVVDKLKDAGFENTYIIYTPDFSGLNQEPYYAVTTGFYPTEQTANENLANVKDAGYAEAYVRYTGTYAGSDPRILEMIHADQKGVDSANTTGEITLNDELREKLVRHYEQVFKPSGTFVCFDIDDEVIENGYRTAIRYQMSDEEAEAAMSEGRDVLPNRYAFTIEIDTSNGNVKMTEADPFCDWSEGRDLAEYDWNLY